MMILKMNRNKRALLCCLFHIIWCCNILAINHQVECETIYGRYGLQKQQSAKDYKKYIGKEFSIIQNSTDEKDPNNTFVIQNIITMGNSFLLKYSSIKDLSNIREIKIGLKDKDVSIYNLPFVFMEMIEREINNSIGNTISFEGAKNVFKIIDTKFEKYSDQSSYKSIVYYIQDSESKIVHRISNMDEDHTKLSHILFKNKRMASLVSVEKPTNTFEHNKISAINLNDSLAFSFADKIVSVIIQAGHTSFNFIIKNISDNSIKILWNEASYVGTDGFTSQIMHSGIKYFDKEKLQTPTIIISGASLSDGVIPINNATWSDVEKRWIESPLINYDNSSDLDGKTMKLMIPIQIINGIVNEYIFTFRIRNEFLFPGVIQVGDDEPTIPNGIDENLQLILI